MTALTRKEFDKRLQELAANDVEFRRQLVMTPKAVIAAMLNTLISDDCQVFIHEEDEHTLHLVLSSEILSSAELQSISAGMCWSHANAYYKINS